MAHKTSGMKETYRNMTALGSVAGIILITAGMVNAHMEGTYVRTDEYTSHIYMTMAESINNVYGSSWDLIEVDLMYPFWNVTVGDVIIYAWCERHNGTDCLEPAFDGGMVNVIRNEERYPS